MGLEVSKQKKIVWRKIMQEKFKANKEVIMPTDDDSAQCRSLWRNVTRMVPNLQQHISYKLKNRKGIRFWHDRWLVQACLKDLFPEVYKASRQKQAFIADMIHHGRWHGVFRNALNGNAHLEWDLRCRYLGDVPTLVEGEGEIKIMENFSSKGCYDLLVGNVQECDFHKYSWKYYIPSKVSFMC